MGGILNLIHSKLTWKHIVSDTAQYLKKDQHCDTMFLITYCTFFWFMQLTLTLYPSTCIHLTNSLSWGQQKINIGLTGKGCDKLQESFLTGQTLKVCKNIKLSSTQCLKYWHVSAKSIGHSNTKVKQKSNQVLFAWNVYFEALWIVFWNVFPKQVCLSNISVIMSCNHT